MFKDAYDLEVCCASDAALQAFHYAVDCSLRFDRTVIEEFSAVIELDDEFALAHAALARQLFMFGQGEESAAHFVRALSLCDSATTRESNAVKIAHAAVSGSHQAIAMAHEHVETYPTDVFVLAHLLGPFGLLAFSGVANWHEQNIALLKTTKSQYGSEDWWHLTTQGFFAAEEGRLDDSRRLCERAWDISKNGNCAHSLAHLHFEACALDEGREFILEWDAQYGEQSVMRHHLVWHLAMLDIDNGADIRDVLANYNLEFYPAVNGPSPLEMLADNASFLWRCNLSGAEIPPEVCANLNQYAESQFGFLGFAFADIHKSMAATLHGNVSANEAFTSELLVFAEANDTEVANYAAQFSQGLSAFASEDYTCAIALLEPLLLDSLLVGGSNPQRRIVEETFVEACLRAGDFKRAAAILRSRGRDESAADRNLFARIDQE